MTDMDKKVLAFLKEWLAWAEAGGPEHDVFTSASGLCTNAAKRGRNALTERLNVEFGKLYPFGRRDYDKRWEDRTQHECPKRLAWVRNKIEELENMG